MSITLARPAAGHPVTAEVPPFARRPVSVVAAVVGTAQLVASAVGSGYWFDEALMPAIGRHHLDWGSADQPPVAVLLARLTDWLAPGSVVVLRLPAVLATAAAVVVAALIARELGGDRRAQLLTAGAQATGVWVTFAGHWVTPYSLEPIQWLLIGWLLVRWIRTRNDRLLLWLGLAVGVAAETKFQVLLLCAILLLAVLAVGPRELLRRPQLWAGTGIAVLIAAPTLVWQALNGWPQLQMSTTVAAESEQLYGGRPETAVLLVVMAGPVGTVLALYGLYRLLRAPSLRQWRFLGLTAVVLYAVFVATDGRLYYLQGLYGLLAAFGALGLQRRREAGGRRLRAWPAYLVSAALAGAVLCGSVAATDAATQERIVSGTAAAYRALPVGQRGRTAVFGETYLYAAYLDAYSPQTGLPPAFSANRSYGWFALPPDRDDSVLYVGTDPSALRGWFDAVRQVGALGNDPEGNGRPAGLWLLTGKRVPWTQIWPSVRTLAVG